MSDAMVMTRPADFLVPERNPAHQDKSRSPVILSVRALLPVYPGLSRAEHPIGSQLAEFHSKRAWLCSATFAQAHAEDLHPAFWSCEKSGSRRQVAVFLFIPPHAYDIISAL